MWLPVEPLTITNVQQSSWPLTCNKFKDTLLLHHWKSNLLHHPRVCLNMHLITLVTVLQTWRYFSFSASFYKIAFSFQKVHYQISSLHNSKCRQCSPMCPLCINVKPSKKSWTKSVPFHTLFCQNKVNSHVLQATFYTKQTASILNTNT